MGSSREPTFSRTSTITARLPSTIGEEDGFVPWATLLAKATLASSTSIASARAPRPCEAEKVRQATWSKVGMEVVSV
ncbi:hypothetical protein SLEP1_g48371 [Rubroshorea leprosula]|uniref:Uncharacterized protein n=1 Tax=Rubroshorea leprosula TaxID=152421 RepID=A0AAV5LUA1_9ROSI|nr:hypothetical protein SLEP1_g48371 [Rubroshorea leprosula]